MFSVEIYMKSEAFDDVLDILFRERELTCSRREPCKRIYTGQDLKSDYGRFWAVFFDIKGRPQIVEQIKECRWFDGKESKDLLNEFLK